MKKSEIAGVHVMRGCPIGCKSFPVETGVTLAIGRLLRCPDCGHLINNVTVAEYEKSLQKWDTTNGTLPSARDIRRYSSVINRRLRTAKGMLKQAQNGTTLRLLDVGCSSGALLKIAAEMGFDVTGVEPAAEACRTAQANGFKVFNGFLADARFPQNSFDVITLFELIEHITDPLALLNECARIIKPNGIIIVNTPNAASLTAHFMKSRWEGFDLVKMGGHISFFTPASMRLSARQTGLRVKRMETRNIRFFEKGQCSSGLYRASRILSQLLAYPVKLAGKGHDLLAYLSKE